MSTRTNLILSRLNNRACESFHSKNFDLALHQLENAESVLNKSDCRPTIVSEAIKHDNNRIFAKPTIDKDNYLFQRLEFDEGFSELFEAELTRPDMSTSILQATILYNKAQIQIRYGNLDEATYCLSLTLSILHKEASLCLEILALSVLGQIYYRKGRYVQAAQYYKKAVKRSKEQENIYHPTIASALNCLSVIYYHMISNKNEEGCLEFAMKCAQRALKIRIQLYGHHHLTVATSYNNIGRLYAAQKQFHNAIKCYRKALEIRHKTGKDLDYAATSFNAAKSFQQLDDLDSALEHYNRFLKIAVKRFTKKHRDVANVLSEIAIIENEKGNPEKALKLHKESLEIYQITLGKDHPETRFAYNRLADFHFSRRSYDAALEAYQIGLKGETNTNQRMLSIFHMGEIYREKREYYHAIEAFRKVLSLQKISATKRCDMAITLHTIGVTYFKQGRLTDAMEFLREAISCYDISCLDITPSMIALAIILTSLNELTTAMDLLKEAFSVRCRELGPDHKDVAFTLYYIAIIHQKKGSFSEAVTLFKEVLRIQQEVLGKEHKNVVYTLLKLGWIFKEIHDFDRALPYFLEALQIQRNLFDVLRPQAIARTLIEVGHIHLAQGRVSSMMESFSEAERTYPKVFWTSRSYEQSYYLYRFPFSNGAPTA